MAVNPHLGLTPKFTTPGTGIPWTKPRKTIKVKAGSVRDCYDVTFLADDRLALSDRKDKSVKILDISGNVIETFRNESYVPYGIAMDHTSGWYANFETDTSSP